MHRAFTALLAIAFVAALAPTSGAGTRSVIGPSTSKSSGPADATVVAVIDFNFIPYHWDFLASKMPQHQDQTPTNDLPLNQAPDKWLPGFPSPKAFDSYSRLDLTLEEKNQDAELATNMALDRPKWETIKPSTKDEVNYYWMPGTKVIGAVDFGTTKIIGVPGDHGQGTTSSSVGNLHGTCPECLLLFVNINGASDSGVEQAIEWAMAQPWIDVITNSYGLSAAVRDRLYSGSNVEAQRKATVRGQTIFFSAGNGNDGSFVVPNTTSFSSQEGPDWIVTVGAITPGEENYYYRKGYLGDAADKSAYHSSYSGAGKPVDIAGIGGNYPTAYTATKVSGTGDSGFGGTSNATPQTAGTYARALYIARTDLSGPSRIQNDGVIAKGGRFACASARKDCELGDGKLTAAELRMRLFLGAIHTETGMSPAGYGSAPAIGEEEFANEGHGSYFGRETGRVEDWLEEFDRIRAPMEGRAKALERPNGELEWMIVDSFCRQHLWGSWTGGYYIEGKTKLPGPDPMWPARSSIESTCPYMQPPL